MINSSGQHVEYIDGSDFLIQPTQNKNNGTLSLVFASPSSVWPIGSATTCQVRMNIRMKRDEKIYENTLAIDLKVSDACDMYRLVSPNFNGQFEFSVAKNGKINYFNVDYSYKPFNPYIHINPEFGGLYGEDFDDARGLILGGDFSLPFVTDAWTDYQVQNKNYNDIFDRQIKNMEVEQGIAKQEATVQAFTGAMSGAMTGAAAGATVGGP